MLTALETAMPGPHEASFEVQVADYLKRLFGARATERRAAIRLAQEHADRQRAESSSSISVGTLRAIAVDPRSGSSLPAAPPSYTQPSQVGSEPPEANRFKFRPIFVAAALLVVAVVGGGIHQLAGGASASGQSAGSSPVPAESLPSAEIAPGAAASPPQAVAGTQRVDRGRAARTRRGRR